MNVERSRDRPCATPGLASKSKVAHVKAPAEHVQVRASSVPRMVLYIECAASRYGSSISLMTLISALDPTRYQPVVFVNHNNPILEELRGRGVVAYPLNLPDWGLRRQAPQNEGRSNKAQIRPAGILLQTLLLPARYLRDVIQYRTQLIILRRLIHQYSISLIHANNQPSSNRFCYLLPKLPVPIIQHIRDARPSYSLYIDKLTVRSARCLCISRAVEENAKRSLPSQPQFAILHDPVDEAFFDHHDDQISLTAYGISAGRPVFCQVGRIIPLKGQDILIRAFAEVIRSWPSGMTKPACVIVGDAPEDSSYMREVSALVEALRIGRDVFFVGYTHDVTRILRASDVLVHFTRAPEGFGRVVAEAQASGLPALVSREGALPELVDHGKNGYICNDLEELVTYMARLMHDDDLRLAMSRNALAAADRYRSRVHADRAMQVYDNTLQNWSGRKALKSELPKLAPPSGRSAAADPS